MQSHLVVLGLELLILGLVASSNLLDLGDGLVFLQNVPVFGFQVVFQTVPLRRQMGHRVSEGLQLRLSRVTAGAGSDARIITISVRLFLGMQLINLPLGITAAESPALVILTVKLQRSNTNHRTFITEMRPK